MFAFVVFLIQNTVYLIFDIITISLTGLSFLFNTALLSGIEEIK